MKCIMGSHLSLLCFSGKIVSRSRVALLLFKTELMILIGLGWFQRVLAKTVGLLLGMDAGLMVLVNRGGLLLLLMGA